MLNSLHNRNSLLVKLGHVVKVHILWFSSNFLIKENKKKICFSVLNFFGTIHFIECLIMIEHPCDHSSA